jgi:hypothetical protein
MVERLNGAKPVDLSGFVVTLRWQPGALTIGNSSWPVSERDSLSWPNFRKAGSTTTQS